MASDAAAIEILSFGDLVERGSYGVHSRFRRVVNMTGGARFVSLVTPEVDAGPLNIVVRGLDPANVRHLRIEAGADDRLGSRRVRAAGARPATRGLTIILDGDRIEAGPERVYSSTLGPAVCDSPRFHSNLRTFGACLVELAPEKSLAFLLDPGRIIEFRSGFERGVAEHIEHCVRDILFGDTLRGVSRLKGCGFGLTPSGDDFITGLLIASHLMEPGRRGAAGEYSGYAAAGSNDIAAHRASAAALRARIFESARTSNTLSDTFLRLAAYGRVTRGMQKLAASLSSGTSHDVTRCARDLVSIGATSGVDTGVGLYLTLRSGFGRSARAARGLTGGPHELHAGEAQWS